MTADAKKNDSNEALDFLLKLEVRASGGSLFFLSQILYVFWMFDRYFIDIIRKMNHRYVLDMKDNLGKVKEDSQTTVGTPVIGLGIVSCLVPFFPRHIYGSNTLDMRW